MAALNFPNNPEDGQLYPDPAIPGAVQYVWSEIKGTWLAVFQGIDRISGNEPIIVAGARNQPVISILQATEQYGGYMSAADKIKLDALPDPTEPSPAPLVWKRLDDISPLFNGANVSFPMTSGGVPVTPQSASYLMIAVGGVVLSPDEGFYTIGSNLILSTAPRSGTSFSGTALV